MTPDGAGGGGGGAGLGGVGLGGAGPAWQYMAGQGWVGG